MKLSVPYYSQWKDITDTDWQMRSCGLLCLYSAIKFYKNDFDLNPDQFLQRVIREGAFGKSGWIHDKLVNLSREAGVMAKRVEFRAETVEETKNLAEKAFRDFTEHLEEGKVIIISTIRNWQEKDKFHQVLLVGFEGANNHPTGWYVHDPDTKTREEGAYQYIPHETFKDGFRGLAIFVGL